VQRRRACRKEYGSCERIAACERSGREPYMHRVFNVEECVAQIVSGRDGGTAERKNRRRSQPFVTSRRLLSRAGETNAERESGR